MRRRIEGSQNLPTELGRQVVEGSGIINALGNTTLDSLARGTNNYINRSGCPLENRNIQSKTPTSPVKEKASNVALRNLNPNVQNHLNIHAHRKAK